MLFSIVLARQLTIATAQMVAHPVRLRLLDTDVDYTYIVPNRCTERDMQGYASWGCKFDLFKGWSKHHLEWFVWNKRAQHHGMSWSE